jgi:hypothetical protein
MEKLKKGKQKQTVVLSVIHYRQNPLESSKQSVSRREDGSRTFRNIGKLLLDYTESHSRR